MLGAEPPGDDGASLSPRARLDPIRAQFTDGPRRRRRAPHVIEEPPNGGRMRLISLSAVLPALGAALFLSTAPAPADAQEREWLNPDVIALRDEVEALAREVERLRSGVVIDGGSGGGGGGAVGGDVYARLGQLETELRRMRGEIERLEFGQRRAVQARDQQIAQLEFRIAVLEEMNGIEPAAPSSGLAGQFGAPAGGALGGGALGGSLDGGLGGGGDLGGGDLTAGPGGGDGLLGTLEGVGDGFDPVVDEPQFEGGSGGGAPADPALYDRALESLRAGAFEDAERQFLTFIDGSPDDPRVGEAVFWLGETYFVRGMYQEAARAFLSGFRDHRDGPKAADSLLKLGMTLAQLSQRAEACQTFAQVPQLYPDASPSVLRRASVEAQRAGCS